MPKPVEPTPPPGKPTEGNRKKIGAVDLADLTLDGLTPAQKILRETIIHEFKAKRVAKFAATQVDHINASRQIGEAIRYLFDEHGRPPANAPLEDIMETRKKIEVQLRWLEAVTEELRMVISTLTEFENDALDLLSRDQDKD